MNTESVLTPLREIQGTIINVSFPRSGHRFLREILSGYFENCFVFYEPYTKNVTNRPDANFTLKNVNYVKTHDFHLTGRRVLIFEFPKNRRYLVQIRHPLESIASYYEFSVKHGHIRHDNEVEWHKFLTEKLNYWKRFNNVWLLKKPPDSLLISYDDICSDTFKAAKKAIRFLTNQTSIDSIRLAKVIKDQEILQYVGDAESKKQNRRQLKFFKYFNAAEFGKLEHSLFEKYLQPNGIGLLFDSNGSLQK